MPARTPLPEIRRDQIAGAATGPHLPSVGIGNGRLRMELPPLRFAGPKMQLPQIELPRLDLPNLDLPRVDLSQVDLPKVEVPKLDLPKVDVARAVAEAGERTGLRRRPASRGWLPPGLLVATLGAGAVATVALLRRRALQEPVSRLAARTRDAIAQLRAGVARLRGERTELIALDIAVPAASTNAPDAPPASMEESLLASPPAPIEAAAVDLEELAIPEEIVPPREPMAPAPAAEELPFIESGVPS